MTVVGCTLLLLAAACFVAVLVMQGDEVDRLRGRIAELERERRRAA